MSNLPGWWIFMLAVLFVTACNQENYEDLEVFVGDSGTGLRGRVDPLPEIQPAKHFVYQAFEIPDPFSSQKNKLGKLGQDELRPDLKRSKETLESFSLENLVMVGSLQRGKHIFALVRAPDNTVHRIRVGNYPGQNFGLITRISETEIKLKEITQDGENDWVERVGALMLQTQEQK